MTSLSRYALVLAFLFACKGKATETTSGSAAPPVSGSATGSAAGSATGSAAVGSGSAVVEAKLYEGPTWTVSTTLPGPETKEKEIDTDAGRVTMSMYTFGPEPSDANSLAMVETNPVGVKVVSSEKVLEASMVGMIRPLKATVDDKKMVTVGKTEMLDFTSHFSDEDGDFFLRGRVAVLNDTLYQVVAMGTGKTTSPWAEAFVSAFRLK
jgi:hypothetical protein